jgi:glycosyltransferase involved in cell wall biosynthesis
MFFFCQKHIDESLKSVKAPAHKLHLVHWGPDVPFYDGIMKSASSPQVPVFISTGKENRDIQTLMQAFANLPHRLDIYIAEECGGINYRRVIESQPKPDNINVHFTEGVIPHRLAQIVAECSCVVIPCLDFPYTVGLTTLVEALALGLPLITSRNTYFPMDIDREGIGITVPYGDVQGWADAVEYIVGHPDEARQMGRRARLLAEKVYNMEVFGRELAEVINSRQS